MRAITDELPPDVHTLLRGLKVLLQLQDLAPFSDLVLGRTSPAPHIQTDAELIK